MSDTETHTTRTTTAQNGRSTVVSTKSGGNGGLIFIVGGMFVAIAFILALLFGVVPMGSSTGSSEAPAAVSIENNNTAPEAAAPATDAPATEAPATEAPATEAPATEAPAAGN